MVGVVVDPGVVSHIYGGKFPMLVHWPYAFFPEISAEFVSVVSLVSGERFDPIEISFEYLPAELRIMRLFHRTMYI